MSSNSAHAQTTHPATPKLTYSGLPAGSRIVAEPTARGITIHIPPKSIVHAILGCAFASLMLTPMTVATLAALINPHSLQGSDWIIAGFVALVILTAWPIVIVIVWQSIRRRRVPTICTVSDSTLILITPDLPTMRHTFAIDAGLQVAAFPRGIGITLHATGELGFDKDGERLTILRGRDYRELQWIALALNEGMRKG